MISKVLFPCAVALGLAGCESVQERSTNSQFGTATAERDFTSNLGAPRTGSDVDANGEGYVYQVGTGEEAGLAGQAGLIPGTDTAAWAKTGTGTFSGTYEAFAIEGIGLMEDQIYGWSKYHTSDITLSADFAKETLKGTSSDGTLVVNGQMDGKVMAGDVTFKGTSGDLQGKAGSDAAFGVFHGNSEDIIFAGGFAATRD